MTFSGGTDYTVNVLTQSAQEQFAELSEKVISELKSTFPFEDSRGRFVVDLKDISVGRPTDSVDDIKGQMKAKLNGKTWSSPITGTVQIKDKNTGKVLVERKGYNIGSVPRVTRHYTYIIGGKEKALTNQWRLRPGPYVRPTNKPDEYRAQFQLAKGPAFRVEQDAASGYMWMSLKGRKFPMYSVLKAQGVSDEEMRNAWGDRAFEATKKKANTTKNYADLYQTWKGKPLPAGADARQAVTELFQSTELDPTVAKITVGVESSQVNAPMLLSASKKLIDVTAGKVRPDPIDSLGFKELWTPTDHLADRIRKSRSDIQGRMLKALSKPSVQNAIQKGDPNVVRDIVMPDLIRKPIYGAFSTSLATGSGHTNPISLLADKTAVTIAGPGGIQNAQQISEAATAVDPSHLGYVDPTYTPEGDPGVTTHLAAGVIVKDRKPYVQMYNLKTGKTELVDAATAQNSTIVLPDQVKWKNGKPTPIGKTVRIKDNQGEIRDDSWTKATYVLPDPGQVFATETNLVPFMQNDSAGRTTMSARHIGQSISVVGREAPLVQSMAGKESKTSFEEHLGRTFAGHPSPTEGKVLEVKKDEVIIQGKDGKKHSVHLYNHYPLSDAKAQIHSTPLVKVGDTVKQGQALADTSFTKNGVLALGTNLRTAYIANGYNHEDGIVISESAAKKLGTEHLYKPSLYVGQNTIVDKKKFMSHRFADFDKDTYDKIGDDGVIKPGTKVKPGDPLILALTEMGVAQGSDEKAKRKLQNRFRDRYSNATQTWDSNYEGEVVRVARSGNEIVVHVKTIEPMQVGSKLSTRHSAKGIVAAIVPDEEMPHTKDGKPIQMLLNPVGVPGRMNAGQILETVAGKIAEKTGKPYKVKNFDTGVDYLKQLRSDLKKHNISETEDLIDPKTGRVMKNITVGPHYTYQLKHQIDEKTQVRSGGWVPPEANAPAILYDPENKQPKGGGKAGAHSLGTLGVYGALASGLKHNLQEMATLKSDSDQAADAWDALTNGHALPTPKTPFAYKKFENMLRGAGINVEKTGREIRLIPQTDKDVLNMSMGEITKGNMTVRAKDDAPIKGGLYDYEKTGGPQGNHWSHIKLAEPMPNPVFSKPVEHLLGLKHGELPKLIAGEIKLPNGKYGGAAIREALRKVDVNKELKKTHAQLHNPKTKDSDLNKLYEKYHALKLLQEKGLNPADAYTMQYVPVLPPVLRPMNKLSDGSVKISPTTDLYRRLSMVNQSLKSGDEKMPYGATKDVRLGLYNELQNLMGTTAKDAQANALDMRGTKEDPNMRLPGILHQIHGKDPKSGFFQSKLLGKRMDYTSRVTITGNPDLSMDEVGVPKKVAAELYRPMVAKRLIQAGYDPIEAHKMISRKDATAIKMLEQEVAERPLLMKRDPVLHQHSIIGQKVKLTDSPSVSVSPLVMPPLGADVDGDQVTLMVPLSKKAVDEVYTVLPSSRPINPSTGEVVTLPTNESALALYRTSIPRGEYKGKISSVKQAEELFYQNKLDLNQKITIDGIGTTTLGRVRMANALPKKYRKDIITKLDKPFDRKWQKSIIQDLAKNSTPAQFRDATDKLSRIGFNLAYESGHSVTLKDLEPVKGVRDTIIRQTALKANRLAAKGDEAGAQKAWISATDKIHKGYAEHFKKNPTNVSDMAAAGIKARREQFQGLIMAPMLVEDHKGTPSKSPITKSFAEGVDVGGYFLQAAGARRGLIQKTQATSEPGFFSKNLMQVNADQHIEAKDCGVAQGVMLSTNERDFVDRYLASSIKVGSKTLRAGTLVTPEIARDLKGAKIDRALVRSPLKCRLPQGVCAKCMGRSPAGRDYEIGEPIGVISAHAIGERATQLMLKQTHAGGIVGTGEKTLDSFSTVESMFSARPKNERHAQVAPGAGKVISTTKRPTGGWDITIEVNGKRTTIYSRQDPLPDVRPGYSFRKGERLTQGDAHMQDLINTRGIDSAQMHMAKKIGDIYAKEGVLRRYSEVVVRNNTSLMRVTDPGDYHGYVRGDHVKKQVIDELNRTVLKGKRPIKATPVFSSSEMLPLKGQQDWMARLSGSRIGQSIRRAATFGQSSTVGGRHPVPTMVQGGLLDITSGIAPAPRPMANMPLAPKFPPENTVTPTPQKGSFTSRLFGRGN